MIQIIMGLKGSGKTKKLIDSVNQTAQSAQGAVVCIEYGSNLRYEIKSTVRLVSSKEYGIDNIDKLKGFLSGLHAGNFDITHVFIDNLYKTIGTDVAAAEEFISWCANFAAVNNMNITMTISESPENLSEDVKKYL